MLGLSAGRGKRDAPPPWCRAIAYKNRSSRSLSGGSRTRGCHTGFLPLKGGGEEGVGPASIDSQNLGHRRSQTLIRGTNPAYPRSGADPLLSSPFKGRNPVWQPRVLLPPDGVRDDLFSYAIALPFRGGMQPCPCVRASLNRSVLHVRTCRTPSLPGTGKGDREAVGGDAGRVRKNRRVW